MAPALREGQSACGHRSSKSDKREAPAVGMDYMHTHSEQVKEEEYGMPIMVTKDEKANTITADVVPSKGVGDYAVESVRKALEQLGHQRIALKSDSEPAILALKEAARRE